MKFMRILQYIKKLKSAKNSLKQKRLYALLFTLTLCLVLSTSAVPSYSQTPTPTPRPVIEQKVRELAKNDVENDIPRRNDYAVKRYGKKSPDLKDDEILEIYDNEYTKQLEAKKNNLWEQLKPETGWSVAIVLFFILIFKDTLTTWVSQGFEFIGNQLYSKLSGTSWLRGAALKRYRKEIQEKYENLKISFRPNRPLKLKDIYVPLKVTGTNDTDLIDAFQAVAKYRRLMVKGSPGSGKTMLLKYIALCYAEGRWADLFKKFQCVPVLVELHRFSNKELTVEQQLVEAFARDGFPNAQSFVSQSLDKNKLLLLLDGFDEVSSNERQKVVDLINDFLDTHKDCPVIITCRTAVYRGEFNDFMEQTLEVVEFNDQQIREFLVPWKPDMPASKSVEQLIQTLHDRPRIMELARNPLMLTIIAYLYADTPVVLPHSRAEFYRIATDILLEQWHKERNQFQARDKKLILQHLALFFQDNANQQGQDRRSVDWKKVENEITSILPNLNLQPDCTRAILSEIVERNGLLLRIDGGERYQFAHLTLQEFFAASQLREDANGLVNRFKADPDAWRETLKLWCGIAGDSTNLIREVRTVNPVVAFECLADVQKVDSTLALEIINSFKSRLGEDENEDIVNHAFASVAADDRRRADVFSFLKETLENTSETDARRKAAVNALSLTNLPSAAELLTQQYANLDNIEFRLILDQALIRMGDIAVPEIKKAVTSDGINQVMDALVGIGTPNALQALVDWLWSDNENRVLRAALLLASLIKEEKHKTMLNTCKLPKAYSRPSSLSFDWICEPYNADKDSFRQILEQIAYCISKKLKSPVSVINQLLIKDYDQKLIIPICLIQALENDLFNRDFVWQSQEKSYNLENSRKNYEINIQKLCASNTSTVWEYLINNINPNFVYLMIFLINVLQISNSKKLKEEWKRINQHRLGRMDVKELFRTITEDTVDKMGMMDFDSIKKYLDRNSGMIRYGIHVRYEDYLDNMNLKMKIERRIEEKRKNGRRLELLVVNEKFWEGKVIINKKLAPPPKKQFFNS
ncbi:signal transduction protein (plasmid) [Nostoc sp. HK-01]|nr:signal transduction protein [Nostoc sp. HK-01]